jgi:hypothetical protein
MPPKKLFLSEFQIIENYSKEKTGGKKLSLPRKPGAGTAPG